MPRAVPVLPAVTPGTRCCRVCSVLTLGAAVVSGGGALAQEAAGARGQSLLVTPRVSVSERYTNNATQASTAKRSDFITQISPGISIRSNGARLKGSLNYALNAQYYANNTSGDSRQNSLNTAWVLEAVDNWAYVDFSGNISQQAISAFGTRTADSFTDNANSTEVSTYKLSPYVRGQFAGLANYEARLNFTSTNSDSTTASDQRSRGGMVRLNGLPRGAMGWSLDASSDRTHYSLARTIQNDQFRGYLNYVFNPQLDGFLLFGRESNNFSTLDKESSSVSGLGLNWRPSVRTKLAANVENHGYGRSHGLTFEHRTARTAWRISDTRSVSNSPIQSGSTAVGTLAGLLDSQFTALEPDPLRRAELVNSYLLANGYNPNALVLSNFLSSTASLQRRQEISFTLLGLRDTINVSVSRGGNRRLSNLTTAFDDLSNVDNVDQSGFRMSYAHRLTPLSSVSFAMSRQNTASSGGVSGTSLRVFDVILSSRLGRQTNVNVGVHRALFDSTTTPYAETALTGTLSLQF